MKIRRIVARVDYVRETRFDNGVVYRTITEDIDVTCAVLALSYEELRAIRDNNLSAQRLVRGKVPGDVTEVVVLQSILDHFGVDRLREVTNHDLHTSRVYAGMMRNRVRRTPAKKAA